MGSKLAVRAEVAAAVLCCALSAQALADPKADAGQHLQASAKLFQDGKFSEALDEVMAAYKLDPQPGLLYSIGQIHVKLDQCDQAIVWYRQFLDTKPDAKPTQAATEAITACEKTLKSQGKPIPDANAAPPAPAPTPPPAPAPPAEATPAPLPETPSPSTTTRGWYADPVLDGLAVAGIAGGVVGIVYYSKAHSDYDSANHASDYSTHHSLIDKGQSAQTISLVASAAGTVLVAGAIARYFISDRGEAATTVGVAPTSGGASITWGGRF